MNGRMFLLPPAKHLCQICAAEHQPHEPHNRDSLYYQTAFQMEHGSWPTWADALEHCSAEVKKLWVRGLTERGATIGEVTPKRVVV